MGTLHTNSAMLLFAAPAVGAFANLAYAAWNSVKGQFDGESLFIGVATFLVEAISFVGMTLFFQNNTQALANQDDEAAIISQCSEVLLILLLIAGCAERLIGEASIRDFKQKWGSGWVRQAVWRMCLFPSVAILFVCFYCAWLTLGA